MFKKALAVLAVAVVGLVSIPSAAQALYAPEVNITINGDIGPGATVNIVILAGTFQGGENVSFAVTGSGNVTIASAAITTDSVVKTASADGAASAAVTLPTNASGSYAVTATGLTSGVVASTSLTVPAADAGAGSGSSGAGAGSPAAGSGRSGDNLAFTGVNGVPMLLIWTASGVLLLGIALIVVMNIVRRQRADA